MKIERLGTVTFGLSGRAATRAIRELHDSGIALDLIVQTKEGGRRLRVEHVGHDGEIRCDCAGFEGDVFPPYTVDLAR